MKKSFHLLIIFLLLSQILIAQNTWKDLRDDPRVNVYDVIREAEKYFEGRDKGEGSGWTGYQRWKNQTEPRFYPTGDRSKFDPAIAAKEYYRFRENQPASKTTGTGDYWTELGPGYATNYLPPAYAPGVGRVETVWSDLTGDTIFLGSRSGGFWKSTDAGSTWHSTTQHLPAVGVWDLAVNPKKHSEVFILTRNGSNYSRGLMKSADYGETWDTTTLSMATLDWEQLKKIIIPATTPDTLYVSSNNGFYVSFNSGTSWTKTQTSNVRDFEVKPGTPGKIYLILNSNNDEVLISTDGGLTFPTSTLNSANAGASSRLRTCAANPSTLYFQSSNGVWRSTNSGGSFSFRGSVPDNMAFGVNDLNQDVLVIGGLDQHLSTDGGLTFSMVCAWPDPLAANYVHADGRSLRSFNGVMYLCTDGYLAKSTDEGTTWNIINPVGTPLKEFYRLGITPMRADLIIGGSQDNGTSAKVGDTWYEWLGADGMTCHGDRNNHEYWFGTWQLGGIQHSNQNGQNSWYISPSSDDGEWVIPYELDPCNDNTVFAAFDTIYKSNDNGANWQALADFSSIGNLNHIAISPSDSNYIYVGKGSRIWKSINNGNSFSEITGTLPGLWISRIAIHPKLPQTVVVSFSDWDDGKKVYRSTNGGTTWTNISGTLPNLPTASMVYEDCPEERIYVGMDAGVYYRDNTTPDWILYDDSLPKIEVTDLKINQGAHLLIAGTWGRGAWCAPLVGKSEHPAITRIDISPAPTLTTPTQRDSVGVHAVITDNGSIAQAWLNWGLDGITYPNPIQMISVSGDTFRLVSQIPPHVTGTKVYFRITAIDDTGDTTQTEKLLYKTYEATLCAAEGSVGTGGDWVSEVVLSPSGFTHSSGQDYYGDFRTLYYPNVLTSSTYNLDISLNYSFTPDSVFAWADWNNNWTFSPDEQIEFSILNASHTATASFTVPADAVLDTIVLRVRNIYDFPATAQPCDNYFGDVEDYSLVVNPLPVSIISEDEIQVKIYPVPASNILIAEIESSNTLDFKITNTLGQEIPVPAHPIDGSKSASIAIEFNLNGLPSGIYFLSLGDGQRNRVVKFSVVK